MTDWALLVFVSFEELGQTTLPRLSPSEISVVEEVGVEVFTESALCNDGDLELTVTLLVLPEWMKLVNMFPNETFVVLPK